MTTGTRDRLLRRCLAPALIVACALPPTLAVAWKARRLRGGADASELAEKRRRLLAAMPTDPPVLINVQSRELPASPDVLGLGKRAVPALERCLSDNIDADVRSICALLLGRFGDRRALPTLWTALDAWEPGVRREVILALRRVPDEGSFGPLMKVFNRQDETSDNRRAVIETLGTLGSPKAVQVLRKELHQEQDEKNDGELRSVAFAAVWRSRHLMARTTLVDDVAFALKSKQTDLVRAAVGAAAELRAPKLVRPLIPLLEHPDSRVRNRAVYALGLIGDRSAQGALLAALPRAREARMLNNIAFALERLDRAAFFQAIAQVMRHKQAIIRLNAAFVLGDVRRPEGLPLLREALKDPSDYVKTSAIVAIGKLKLPEAAALLEPLVTSPNPAVREEAIYAVYDLTNGARRDLVYRLFGDQKNESVRRRAALTLGAAGDERVRDYLLQCLEDRRCGAGELDAFLRQDRDPRVADRVLLTWARERPELTDVLAARRPPGTLTVALSGLDSALAHGEARVARRAFDLVGDLGDRAARPRLAYRFAPEEAWLRVHAAVALARLGETAADATLMGELDNFPASRLPGLAAVVMRIAEPPVRARLTPELKTRAASPDFNLALAAAAIQLHWDPEAAFFRFLEGLASPRVAERDLAEAYLKREKAPKVTWLLRRALAREGRPDTRDRLRQLLDQRERKE
ncbi:MAG TPA: HEAT repeat domain-containing protein [Polyangia bacterium]